MAKKIFKAGPLRVIFPTLLLFGPALLLIFISTRGCNHSFKVLDDYGKVPDFQITLKNGEQLTNNSFKNQVVLFTAIQPSCPDTCGLSVWHMGQLIYKTLRENQKKFGHVKMVSIVTDNFGNPSDKIEQVEAYLKDAIEGYDPKIWMIAKGDAKAFFDIKNNGYSLLQKDKQYFAGQSFTELMILSDKVGHVRMVLPGKTESTIRTMKDHMALLDKEYDKKKAAQKK